ncbi:MAG: SDR family NAD(P)-dependent oxidoreductase, partial [Thiotrichales bacterium]|nr:SDR family NAD(P)-dependent oxidoreductase [Thiotrichales bacterium]
MSKRTVLITGCSTGIGYHCAIGLKERGYRVFATARKKQDVERLADEGFESVQLDLANSESIRNACD